jgi:predicted permease
MQDLCYAIRMLRRNPVFTAIAVATLALGIGANTAIFSLVHAVLVRPLPFHEPQRLVWISNPGAGSGGIPGITGQANFRDWREQNVSLEGLAAYLPSFAERIRSTLTGDGEPERLKSIFVTGHFLEVLGVYPQLGRGFVAEDCLRRGPKAVMLTDSFWRRRFHGDPGVIGRAITIDDAKQTVIGVLPASFDFSAIFIPGSRQADVVRSFPDDAPGYDNWGNLMAVIGRLKPGVTVQEAQAEFDHLNQLLRSAHPERGSFGARLTLLPERIAGGFRRALTVLSCAVGSVLLIACANLSNLLLARAAGRRKEIAVRIALGATKARLVRQMLTESLLLSFCGATIGLPLAWFAVEAITRSHAINIPLLQTARVNGVALGFTFVVAIATGLLFGIVPAFQLSNANVHGHLKEAGRGAGHSRGRVWMRELLVASEVAIACLLLVAGGLFLRSFVRLLEVDLGFRTEQAAAWRIQPSRHFSTNTESILYYKELLNRIEALPGVESACMTDKLPMDLNDAGMVRAKGETYGEGHEPTAFVRMVSQGYFRSVRIPLKAGRDFDSHDASFDWRPPQGKEMVAIVNEKFGRLLWPGKEALGQEVLVNDTPGHYVECRVVGVAGDVRQSALDLEGGPEIYVLDWGGELVVRAKGTLKSLIPAVRASLRTLDPNMPLNDFRLLDEIVENAVAPKRLITLLLGLFSGLALLLASVGVYGVIAFSVSQRTQEIGIRLALGSSSNGILRLIVGEGMRMVFIGCGVGLIISLALARVIQALLFDVSATDPLTFVASSLTLIGAALLACWLPARRASGIDPAVALRSE